MGSGQGQAWRIEDEESRQTGQEQEQRSPRGQVRRAPGLLPDSSPTTSQPPSGPVPSTSEIPSKSTCPFPSSLPAPQGQPQNSPLLLLAPDASSSQDYLVLAYKSHLITHLFKTYIYMASHCISGSAKLFSRASRVLHDLAPANVSGHFPSFLCCDHTVLL